MIKDLGITDIHVTFNAEKDEVNFEITNSTGFLFSFQINNAGYTGLAKFLNELPKNEKETK